MLLKFFKSNLPYVIFFIPILGAILWLPSLYPELTLKQAAASSNSTAFFNWLTVHLQSNYYLNISSALAILIIQSYLLIRLNFKYIFIDSKTYLPAIIFILAGSSIYAYQNINAALIANLALLISIDRCFKIEKDKNQFKRYFESGLFVGIASLIYPIAIYFIAIIWITQVLLRTFNWREWISSIIGLIVPLSFAVSIAFLKSNLNNFINSYITFFTGKSALSQPLTTTNTIAMGMIIFFLIIALLSVLRIIGTKKISIRKYFSLFLWMILLTIATFTLIPSAGFELIFLITTPLSIILAMFFIETRNNWLAELFFSLFFFSIFIILWF